MATGAHWRRDALARHHLFPIPTDAAMPLFTPDDIMAGKGPQAGRIALYDDDHFYMGSVIAEALVARSCTVDLISPDVRVAAWAEKTLEQAVIQRRLMQIGVRLHLSAAPQVIGPDAVTLACTWTGAETTLPADAVVMVTSRIPDDALFQATRALDWAGAGIRTVRLIGDAAAPGPIAWATYAGRRYAEDLDSDDIGDTLPFRREIAELARDW
jgi:dimethylamine/trimethylamine dehydrogenase